MQHIESPKNPRIAAAARLHRSRARRDTGETLIEGPHVLAEAMNGAATVRTIFSRHPSDAVEQAAAAAGIEVVAVTDAVLERLAGTAHPRGPIAIIAIPADHPPATVDSLVLAGVADPGNAGTIIRSAAAFGFQVVVAGGGVDVWSPKVLRAGAGGHFRVRMAHVPAHPCASLREGGLVTAALVVRGGDTIESMPDGPVAFLVGSEPHGLPREIVDRCDLQITLPMVGTAESLNASVAASIAMYERARTSR